jgi:hypothetical protein
MRYAGLPRIGEPENGVNLRKNDDAWNDIGKEI